MGSVFYILYMQERKDDNLSNGAGLTSKHHPIQWKTLEQCGVQNLSRCCVAIFWPDGLCIRLSPIGARPRVSA
jgi:hypothetical protein